MTTKNVFEAVQLAIDNENEALDQRLVYEQDLRKWAQDTLGFAMTIGQIEELNKELKTIPNNGTLIVKSPQVVDGFQRSVTLFKTSYGTVERLDRYVFNLERAIITSNQKAADADYALSQYTDLSFFGLITLAFARLFNNGSK